MPPRRAIARDCNSNATGPAQSGVSQAGHAGRTCWPRGDEGITAMTYTMQANEFRSPLFRVIGRAVER
jgi:hypothetical protein